MGLTELWIKSREQLEGKHVSQIIAFAGSGKLRDAGDASQEFRQFLGQVPSSLLVRYADECLTEKFDGNGLALQDVINQVGRRLGFEVHDGRYRGGAGHVAHDGLWRSPDGYHLVVEVKTTDAYRTNLDVVAGYRRALIRSGQIGEDRSSILIIVGREDTGDLEAQIRGSRHAWDVRLISVDALIRLMALKEGTEDPRVHQQIRTILVPREFTKLDGIIDLVFSTAEDVRGEEPTAAGESLLAASPPEAQGPVDGADKGVRKPRFTPVSFHEECIARIQVALGQPLLRRSKATFASPDGRLMLICAVSREHEGANVLSYWFAFHPHQREALHDAAEAYIAFGCGSARDILLITFSDFDRWVDGLWTTDRDDRFYWHVRVRRREGRFVLDRKAGYDPVDLTPYLLKPAPGSIAAS